MPRCQELGIVFGYDWDENRLWGGDKRQMMLLLLQLAECQAYERSAWWECLTSITQLIHSLGGYQGRQLRRSHAS
jgi:hypothetical protein